MTFLCRCTSSFRNLIKRFDCHHWVSGYIDDACKETIKPTVTDGKPWLNSYSAYDICCFFSSLSKVLVLIFIHLNFRKHDNVERGENERRSVWNSWHQTKRKWGLGKIHLLFLLSLEYAKSILVIYTKRNYTGVTKCVRVLLCNKG